MKRCSRCKNLLPLYAFTPNRSRPDGLQNNCRDCQRAYVREHYAENVKYYLAKARRSNAKLRTFRRELLRELKSVPCADCGGVFPPWVMDFDHDSDVKVFILSKSPTLSREGMLTEAAKCDIVCANCHRDRTYRRIARP